jgi:Tfp pilus assembly protein PilF
MGTVLLAVTGPILLIGLGLMLYNVRRFDNPFEFGVRYQLGGQGQVTWEFFSLRYLWFNLRVYFLEPVRWRLPFPFVHGIIVPPVPRGHNGVVEAFGILTNTPLTWLALAAPLAWRGRPEQTTSGLRWFVMGVAVMFGMCALTLSLVCGANLRYEVDFLPALLVLAVVGILGLERSLADRPAWHRAARWGWGLLLTFSVVFNILMSLENYAYADGAVAGMLAERGRLPEAIQIFEEALRIKPDYAEGHRNLGGVLEETGKHEEAIAHYEEALRIKPHYAEAENNLGVALWQEGKTTEAQKYFEEALRINPDNAEAHKNLGITLEQSGRAQEAIAQYEQVLRIRPDDVQVHYNLGIAFAQLGRTQEAMEQWEQALRIKPDFTEARNALSRLRAGQ